MDRPCDYNADVICDRKECYRCGWHPEVAKARQESVRKGLIGDQKLYRIPFTGYCEVWAATPEEAAEKADNDELFTVCYDFGDPECLEKEETDEVE